MIKTPRTIIKRVLTLPALFVFASLSLSASFTSAAQPGFPAVVRIGIAAAATGNPPVYSLGTIGVVRQNQWLEQAFQKQGARVEWYFFKGAGPATNEAMSSGQIDFALLGDLASLVPRSAGLKTRLLLPLGMRSNLYLAVHPKSNIRSFADLKGKKVAIFKGTNYQLAANRILAAHGLSERDLRVINMETTSAQAALISGDVDASFSGLDLLTLRDKGQARIIYSTASDGQRFTRQAALVATEKFTNTYPQATQEIVTALVRAAHWVAQPQNRQAALELWSKQGISAAHWSEESGKDFAPIVTPLFDTFFISRYQDALEEAFKLGLVRSRFDIKTWIDPRFQAQALKSLKLESFWPSYDASGLATDKRPVL